MKKKLLFIIPSLAGGGAERVFTTIINNINKNIYDITLVYLSDKRNVFKVSDQIKVVNLNLKRLRNAPIKILATIKKEKPNLIFSTHGHMNTVLILLKPFISHDIKLIIRQTNIASENFSQNKLKSFLSRRLFRVLKYADKIICQSESMKKDFIFNTKVQENKVIKIKNPIDIELVEKKSLEEVGYKFENNIKHIFFTGRFNEVKRIPLIVNAFEQYHNKNKNSKLYLMGTGPRESEIKDLVKQKNLEDHIVFLGFQKNPYKWLAHADLFILASKSEGMPNALIEVLTLEVPVLILKHPGGTIDILKALNIENRFVDTLLIRNQDFASYKTDIRLALNFNFGIENIIERYEKLFISTLEGN